MPKKFPTTIYVTRENEGTQDEYLQIHTDAESAAREESAIVGVYDLSGVGKVHVTREFTWATEKRPATKSVKR